MIANVLSFLAVAATVALAYPCGNVCKTNGWWVGNVVGADSCKSSSFGPAFFPSDIRVVGFTNPQPFVPSGSTLGNVFVNSALGATTKFASSGCAFGSNAVVTPTQVSVDAPVVSSGCGGNVFSTPVWSSGNTVFTPVNTQSVFSPVVNNGLVSTGCNLVATPTQVSVDAPVVSSGCGQMVFPTPAKCCC